MDCDDESVIRINEALLRQVLTNLLSNAVKYSAPHSTVLLKLCCKADTVIIQVCDEGIGIPLGALERLGESFYRASNVGTIPGTGLGLAIVKQVVEQAGGTIDVVSEVNAGTTFTVVLPIGDQN
ncbi:MAG: sensor histidine kinase [Nodosilinea sp.]